MSPLWRDEVGIYVSPRRIVLSRMKRGIRALHAGERDCAVDGGETSRWEPALEVLKTCLGEEAAWHGVAGRLIIANHWARYAIVPWSDELADPEERLQHARYCLSKTYGDVVTQWTVTLNEAPPGAPQVACAIPSDLLAGIHALTEPHGLRMKSVQPQLTAAFNSWRDRLPKGGAWFVTLEEGSLAAAHFTAGGWDRVRAVRIGDDWEVELKRLHTFGRLASASAEEGRVYVDAPQWLRAKADAGETAFEWLEDEGQGGEPSTRFALLQRMYA